MVVGQQNDGAGLWPCRQHPTGTDNTADPRYLVLGCDSWVLFYDRALFRTDIATKTLAVGSRNLS